MYSAPADKLMPAFNKKEFFTPYLIRVKNDNLIKMRIIHLDIKNIKIE